MQSMILKSSMRRELKGDEFVVQFTDGPTLYGEPIGRIEPGEKAVSLVSGPVGGGKASAEKRREFTIRIAEAKW